MVSECCRLFVVGLVVGIVKGFFSSVDLFRRELVA